MTITEPKFALITFRAIFFSGSVNAARRFAASAARIARCDALTLIVQPTFPSEMRGRRWRKKTWASTAARLKRLPSLRTYLCSL